MKRIVALIISLIMIISLASCGQTDNSATCMTLGNSKITESMYHYWASSYKYQYISSYSDVTNDASSYDVVMANGQTTGDFLDDLTEKNVKVSLVAMYLFDQYNLEIPSSQKQSVSDYISDLVSDNADGDKDLINELLSSYGINLEILKSIYLEEVKFSIVKDYLYNEDTGTEKLSDSDYENYYNENYVHFQMIYINNMYQYAKDDNGNYYTDEDGYYQTEDLDPAEKTKKDSIIQTIQTSLDEGKDFDELYDKYSEISEYENGYYFSPSGSYSDEIYNQLATECQAIEIGETAAVETETGTCIIKRLELEEGAWDKDDNSDFFTDYKSSVADNAFLNKLYTYFDQISIDEEIVQKYTITEVLPCNY